MPESHHNCRAQCEIIISYDKMNIRDLTQQAGPRYEEICCTLLETISSFELGFCLKDLCDKSLPFLENG